MKHLTRTEAQMLAAVGSSISGSREVGKPDPTDDELSLDLTAADFAAVDIRRHLPRVKAMAMDILHAAAELAALALFLTGSGLVAGIFRGVI